MPESRRHPIAAHDKLRIADTDVSGLMLDRALDAIEKKAKRAPLAKALDKELAGLGARKEAAEVAPMNKRKSCGQ